MRAIGVWLRGVAEMDVSLGCVPPASLRWIYLIKARNAVREDE